MGTCRMFFSLLRTKRVVTKKTNPPSLPPPPTPPPPPPPTSVLSPTGMLAPPQRLRPEDRGLWLIELLVACANNIAIGHRENTNLCLEKLSLLASPTGDPMQRIATYFMEALVARLTKAWPGPHKALNRQMFFNLCPFLKVSYMAVNQSIMEAMEKEDLVHVIDLNDCEPLQWTWLMRSLVTRSRGPPNPRITTVSKHKQALNNMAEVLTEEPEKLNIPFQFHPVHSTLENLEAEDLKVKIGEAVAISSVLQLHTLLAEEDNNLTAGSPACPRIDRFLDMLRGLSPKIMVVVEQDSMERFVKAMHYYGAMFDSLASNGSQQRIVERLAVEKYLFGEEIKGIVACEGGERKERHEKLDKWVKRMEGAGFVPVPVG